MSDYLDSPGISQSMLKLFATNPELYRRVYIDQTTPGQATTRSMILGRKIEAYLRGHSHETKVVRVPGSVLTKNGQKRGKAYDAWKAEAAPDVPPELILTDRQYDEEFAMYRRIRDNVLDHKAAKWLLLGTPGRWHQSWSWTCPETGLSRKGESDRWFDDGTLIDLKCVADPTPEAFAKQVETFGYHIQLATYEQGAQVSGFTAPIKCGFVAIRNSEPFDVHTYSLPDEWLDAGREWNSHWIEKLRQAMESDTWNFPMHGEIVNLERPKWAGRKDVNELKYQPETETH